MENFKIIGGKVTVDQAAWMVQKSNQAIYNAIKDGRMTAEIQERGGKSVKVLQILDLERLYQDVRYPGDDTVGQGASATEFNAFTPQTTSAPRSNQSNDDNARTERFIDMMEKRFKDQIAQYEEEVEYLRKAHEKSQETAQRVTLLLEDKTNEDGKIDEWKSSIKALEDRLSNQENTVKEEKEKAQRILRQNQLLKKALDSERKKTIWQKMFG